jgi:hypothetical protein
MLLLYNEQSDPESSILIDSLQSMFLFLPFLFFLTPRARSSYVIGHVQLIFHADMMTFAL